MKQIIAIALLGAGLAGCASLPQPQPVAAPAPVVVKKARAVKHSPKKVAAGHVAAPVPVPAPRPAVAADPVATPVVVNKLTEPRWYDRFRAEFPKKGN